MAEEIELKKFEDYLGQNPPNGSTAPPRTVPAKVLDKNFKKVTLIKDDKLDETNDRTYKLEYKDDGTILKIKKFPRGTNKSDLCYWDPEGGNDREGGWVVLESIDDADLHVLSLVNRELQFTKFPKGTNRGDLLYWNPEGGENQSGAWEIFAAVESENLHLLGISNGELQWTPTAECDEEENE